MINFRRAGNGENVVLLHGLFGMGANLKSISRALSPNFSVYSIDLPDHGGSSWLSKRDLFIYAERLMSWLEEYNLNKCHLIGHSLGGKIAMQMALIDPARFYSLIIVDIAPVSYPIAHQNVFDAMQALSETKCVLRKGAISILEKYLDEAELIQFLSMSLRANEEGVYSWIFNYEGLRRDYPLLCMAPESTGAQYYGPSLFIRGQRSSFISNDNEPSVRKLFPESEILTVPGAGHWVHFDEPDRFNTVVLKFLFEISDMM